MQKAQIDVAKAQHQAALQQQQHEQDAAQRATEHAQTIQVNASKADAEPKAKMSAVINQFAKHITDAQANHVAMLHDAIKKANAPKRIVRDPKTNKISHIEVINE